MPDKFVLVEALDAAIRLQLAKLFEVLLRDFDEQSLTRFKTGLSKLAEAEDRLVKLIDEMTAEE